MGVPPTGSPLNHPNKKALPFGRAFFQNLSDVMK